MPFPYSVRTSVDRAGNDADVGRVLAAVAARLTGIGAAVRGAPGERTLRFAPGQRVGGRYWLSVVTEGRVVATVDGGRISLTATASCPTLLVVGTVVAVPAGLLAGRWVALGMWLWLVGGNYVAILLALRVHLERAMSDSISDRSAGAGGGSAPADRG